MLGTVLNALCGFIQLSFLNSPMRSVAKDSDLKAEETVTKINIHRYHLPICTKELHIPGD